MQWLANGLQRLAGEPWTAQVWWRDRQPHEPVRQSIDRYTINAGEVFLVNRGSLVNLAPGAYNTTLRFENAADPADFELVQVSLTVTDPIPDLGLVGSTDRSDGSSPAFRAGRLTPAKKFWARCRSTRTARPVFECRPGRRSIFRYWIPRAGPCNG